MCDIIVVNKKTNAFDVYIGRGSPLGNPFIMVDYSSAERERVIEEYRVWFLNMVAVKSPRIMSELSRIDELLKNQDVRLGCFCAPKHCHGDVIKEYLNGVRKA